MNLRDCLLTLGAAISLCACIDQPDDIESTMSAVTPSTPRASKLVRSADPIDGHYLVVLDGAPKARLAPAMRQGFDDTVDRLAAAHRATISRRFTAALRGFSARMSESDALALSEDPAVLFVEQDTVVHASGSQSNPTYGLDRIDQPSLPLDHTYNYASDGAGTTVFVIDTGINTTHVEFTGRVGDGAFAIDDGNGVEDCNGHGTHVAGTIAGSTFGVAKRATLIPVRVLDCDARGSSSGVIAGMDYVATNHPARSVVNMSLGGPASEAQNAAVRNLVAAGVTVVVAAGNENQDACNTSPASEPMAITVGSTTNTDARSSFSNFGSCVDVFAPGSGITSAWIGSDTATDTISGTSMASPHVAGAAALYLAQHPDATPAGVTTALLASAVPNKVGDPKGSPNRLIQTTFTTSPPPPPPPPGSTVKITAPADEAEVGPSFEVYVDAAGAASVDLQADGVSLVVDRNAPFAFTITGAPEGRHQLTAVAADAAGSTSTSSITVNVRAFGPGLGNNPVTPPPTYRDDAGCSTAHHGGRGLGLVTLAVLATLRRRRRPLREHLR